MCLWFCFGAFSLLFLLFAGLAYGCGWLVNSVVLVHCMFYFVL